MFYFTAPQAGMERLTVAEQKQMRYYMDLNQKSSLTAGKQLIPTSQAAIWFGNQMIRSLAYMPWKGAILKEINKPYNAITLKDYQRSN